jgi:hypothetical protein
MRFFVVGLVLLALALAQEDEGVYQFPKNIKTPKKGGRWKMYCYSNHDNVNGICNDIARSFRFLSWGRLDIDTVKRQSEANMQVRFTRNGRSTTGPNGEMSNVLGTTLHVALHEVARQFGFGSCHLLTTCGEYEPFSAGRDKVLVIPPRADKCKILQGDKLTIGGNKNGARLLTAGQMHWAKWLTGEQVAQYKGGTRCYDIKRLTAAMCSSGPEKCGPMPNDLFAVQILSAELDPENGFLYKIEPKRLTSVFLGAYAGANCYGDAGYCIALHTNIGPSSRRIALFGPATVDVIDNFLTGVHMRILPAWSDTTSIRVKISDRDEPLDDSDCESRPTLEPTFGPENTLAPTPQPTFRPTERTRRPTFRPSKEPTMRPTDRKRTREPTSQPTHRPTARTRTRRPTSQPTLYPTRTSKPSSQPTFYPTMRPTAKKQTKNPTSQPTYRPTARKITRQPTSQPTHRPTTKKQTKKPTAQPTNHPTRPKRTRRPTAQPTNHPTRPRRTRRPTAQPTAQPTSRPSQRPTSQKPSTGRPSNQPTRLPTTNRPTPQPTHLPTTRLPTFEPTLSPAKVIKRPSSTPTEHPESQKATPTAQPVAGSGSRRLEGGEYESEYEY